MANCQFLYDNIWKAATLAALTEEVNFPVEMTQKRAPGRRWRSTSVVADQTIVADLGTAGLPGQLFLINNSNHYLDFSEGGAEIVATLTNGVYTAGNLCVEIKTQLDAGGAETYTVTHSTTTGFFTIAATGNFELLWSSGTHAIALTDCHVCLGFDPAADDTGAATYTSDVIYFPATAFFIRGNNFSSSAVITIQASHDNDGGHWAAPDFEAVLSPIDNTMMGAFFDEQSYRYWRLLISDATNPDFYAEAGPMFLGTYFEPVINYKIGGTATPVDLSVITMSAGGQRTVVIHDQPGVWQYVFRTAEKPSFENVRRMVGWSLPFIFCEDSDVPNAALYVVATAWEWEHLHLTTWTLTLTLAEEI